MYVHSIRRLLSSVGIGLERQQVEDLMRALIILHDVGKASRIYQRYISGEERLEGFRHELVSAHYTYESLLPLDGELAEIGALTVMMHHEPMLMTQSIRLESSQSWPSDQIVKSQTQENWWPYKEPDCSR
ncbi:MAG: CRISPR-associated endonuclease Cas3'' [Candidatus Korarchaeota archaeon]|nr:CRISPR-associated endonuclease Cas3'' [Candidatus Korarchaeota archaeon]